MSRSALGSTDDRQRALSSGFDLFLETPLQAETLARAIAEIPPRRDGLRPE